MNYISKTNKMIFSYSLGIILNFVLVLVFIKLSLSMEAYLILSGVLGVLGIVMYNLVKRRGRGKSIPFYLIMGGIASAISAVYVNENVTLVVNSGGEGTLSILYLFGITCIVLILFLLMRGLINAFNIYKLVPVISMILSVILWVGVFLLGEKFGGDFIELFYISLFYGLMFISSMITVLFLKGNSNFEFVLLLSFLGSFIFVFCVAISIIFEDGSIFELFAGDFDFSRKKKV
ncbi:MAG: hypothetical protein ACRC2K_08255 [Clostridium sp.]